MFATLLSTTALFDNHFDNTAMIPIDPLLNRLAGLPGMEAGSKRLVVVLGQLGDFDSIEYAQALVPKLPQLAAAGVKVQLFGIGNAEIGRAHV